MKVNAVKLDEPIGEEQTAEYWCERAECLQEWVCELLRKNQELRMGQETEWSHEHRFEEARLPVGASSPQLALARSHDGGE